jgi:heme exporter protein CcmD
MMSSSFWAMGGYARYVWPCYAFACGVLGWNLWSAKRFRVAAQLRARRAAVMTMAAVGES